MDTPVTQTANTDTYIVKPNYEHPKFKALDEAFAKQEHRFEIDRCEFKYNDQAFFIGDSMDKIISIFGEPKQKIITSFNKKVFSYKDKFLNLLFWFSEVEKKLISFSVYLNNNDEPDNAPYDIIKFRKVPYQLDMTLNEFIELSDLQHDIILGHNLAAFYIIGEKECNSIKVDTEIGSTPAYNNIGGGHLTIRGDFDPKVTGPIKSFSISLSELEKYKK